jgi:hypothetical protein
MRPQYLHPRMKFLLLLISSALMSQVNADPAATAKNKSNAEASVTLHSTITGNQEQPKVLYIVPWQGPGGADQLNTGLQPIVSDVFAPVDRREFQRELKYREMTAETPEK